MIDGATTTKILFDVRLDGYLNPPAICRPLGRVLSTDTVELFSALRDLKSLHNENGLILRPSDEAYANAYGYLEAASEEFRLPMPEFTPDGEGGIDIEWQNQGRHLAINFSAAGNGDFISWRAPGGRYEGEPITEELFIDKLDWLMS
jgi:hypothetical protein